MKMLREKYKTFEGASKRARFENGIAPSEYHKGYKSRLYRYSAVEHEGLWRVQRDNGTVDGTVDADFERALAQYILSMRWPSTEGSTDNGL